MKLYCENKQYKLYHGNMLDMLEVVPLNSIDAIVTDPPYELNFMNRSWDNTGIAFQKTTWEKCFKVLKPGGYLLAFGGSRTFHRIACAIEDAGFEIRDTIMWLYGSGFPKSQNLGKSIEAKLTMGTANVKDFKRLDGDTYTVSCGFNKTGKETGYRDREYDLTKTDVNYHTELGKAYSGWGTALKPAYEPVIVARKPCEGSTTDNVIKYGVGGINIDECRIDFVNQDDYNITANKNQHEKFGTKPLTNNNVYGDYSMIQPKNYSSTGRFPSNLILTYDETDEDEVCGGFPDTKSIGGTGEKSLNSKGSVFGKYKAGKNFGGLGDCGSASRYFYCAKASTRDRDEGLEGFDEFDDYVLSPNTPDEIRNEIEILLCQTP